MGKVYTHYFLRSLVGKIRQKEKLLADRIDLGALADIRSLRAFDDLVTAPLNGFRDADHYYQDSSSAFYLDRVRTPTLVLQAEDDPFLPRPALPEVALRANPAIHLALTDRGGHVGFVSGGFRRPWFWAEESSARFLRVVLAGSSAVP
jgi:predicted alpha/beta-fold hydrolase